MHEKQKKNRKWKLSSELTENRTNIRRDDGSRHRNINIVQTLPKGMSEPNLSTNSNVIFRYSASAKMKHWTEHSLDRSVYFFYRCVFFSLCMCHIVMAEIQKLQQLVSCLVTPRSLHYLKKKENRQKNGNCTYKNKDKWAFIFLPKTQSPTKQLTNWAHHEKPERK